MRIEFSEILKSNINKFKFDHLKNAKKKNLFLNYIIRIKNKKFYF